MPGEDGRAQPAHRLCDGQAAQGRGFRKGQGRTHCREPGGHRTTWAQGTEGRRRLAVGWAPSSTCEPRQVSKGETFRAGALEAQLGCPAALSVPDVTAGSCSLCNESFQLGVLISHGRLLPTPPQPPSQNPEKIPFHGFPQSRCRAAGAGPGKGLGGAGRTPSWLQGQQAGRWHPCPQEPSSREGIAPRGPHSGEAKPSPNPVC